MSWFFFCVIFSKRAQVINLMGCKVIVTTCCTTNICFVHSDYVNLPSSRVMGILGVGVRHARIKTDAMKVKTHRGGNLTWLLLSDAFSAVENSIILTSVTEVSKGYYLKNVVRETSWFQFK